MTTYTFTLAPDTKGGYRRYAHPGLGSLYLAKTMLVEPPATVTITAEGLAEPRAAKEQDPAVLEAKATKAAERAQRAAEQAQRLAEQVAHLKAQQPAPQQAAEPAAEKPAAKGKGKAKAAEPAAAHRQPPHR